MANDFPIQRVTYRPVGRVDWCRFLPCALVTLACGLVMASGLFAGFRLGHYAFVLFPVLAGLATGGVAFWAVRAGRCRSRLLAIAFGASAGALIYFGYFHLDFLWLSGVHHAARLDCLPAFIHWRMQTDIYINESERLRLSQPSLNWICFGIDAAISIAVVAVMALLRVQQPYCEHCEAWMQRGTVLAPSQVAAALEQALATGSFETLPPMPRVLKDFSEPHTRIDLEYCPGLADPNSPCVAYLTVTNLGQKRNSGPCPDARSELVLCSQTSLSHAELLALADKLPGLRELAAREG